MIIIYGQRHYGRVDSYKGEYVTSQFAHVWFVPLVPTASRWVTRQAGDQLYGFLLKTNWRSVAAAYLRVWAPIAAAIAAVTNSIPGFALAAVFLGLSAWSWTWRSVRSARERRRAVFNQVVFGAGCDPLLRLRGDCEGLRGRTELHFAEVSNGRTPEDVVRFGADSPMQAALAYAVLRLVAATTRGDTSRNARIASERILDGLKETDAGALADGGPYRSKAEAAAAVEDALEAAAARARDTIDPLPPRAPAPSAWDNSPENPAVQAEIAANKAKRRNLNRLGIAALVIGVPIGGYFLVQHERAKNAAAERGLAEMRRFTDDVCHCPTRACIGDLYDEREASLKRAEKAVENNESQKDRAKVEELITRMKACVNMIPE